MDRRGRLNNNRKNPIAEQSKQWLKDALLQLMEGKPYQSITIKEITDKAALSRRTFYRNFNSKEEILALHFQTICQEYTEKLSSKNQLFMPDITLVFFEFWSKHIHFLKLLKKNHLYYLLLENLNEFVPDVYRIFKGKMNEYESDEDLRYVLAFSTGGFWNMLALWMDDGHVKQPKQLSKVIHEALRASLEEV
jgi:AcrR family transcriptional regulator